MFQHLAQETNAQTWVIASLLFFVGVFALVVIKVLRTPAADLQSHAQLPLDEPSSSSEEDPSSS